MRAHALAKLVAACILAAGLVFGTTACSDSDDGDTVEEQVDEEADEAEEELDEEADEAEAESEDESDGAPQALCDALEPLDQAIDDLDADSFDEWEAQFNVVQERYDDVQSAAGGEYTEELAQFESALNEFDEELQSAEGDPISGILGLVDASADLVVAGEALDEQIDCPNE